MMAKKDKLEDRLQIAKYISSYLKGFTIGLGISSIAMAANDKKQFEFLIGTTVLTGVGYLISEGVIVKTKKELLINNLYADDSIIEKKKEK